MTIFAATCFEPVDQIALRVSRAWRKQKAPANDQVLIVLLEQPCSRASIDFAGSAVTRSFIREQLFVTSSSFPVTILKRLFHIRAITKNKSMLIGRAPFGWPRLWRLAPAEVNI